VSRRSAPGHAPAARVDQEDGWIGASHETLQALLLTVIETLLESLDQPEVSPTMLRCAVTLLKHQKISTDGTREGARKALRRLRVIQLGSH
jgi:hypothetical protein